MSQTHVINVGPGWKLRFYNLSLFFFVLFCISPPNTMPSNQLVTMIKYCIIQLFIFSALFLKNWNCSSVTEMEQKSTFIIISIMETCRVGILLVCVLSLAFREFNLIYRRERQHIQRDVDYIEMSYVQKGLK